jgi:4-carboxymuconolactone decarboxylase
MIFFAYIKDLFILFLLVISCISMSKSQLGKKRILEILGPSAEQIIQNLSEISPDFANYIIEIGYGEFYSRPGISDKEREQAAVACLIGQGNTGLPLKAHMRGMLNVGYKKSDIIELLIFLIPYVGFPAIVDSMITANVLFKEYENR